MWNVHISITPQPRPTPTNKSANNLMVDSPKPELLQWYHTTLCSPVKHALIQAINRGYFATQPNLTIDLINNHIPPSMATSKGHMHQTRNNLNSAEATLSNTTIGTADDTTGTKNQHSVQKDNWPQEENSHRTYRKFSM